MKFMNVWRLETLARHREKQFLMTVRIKKTEYLKIFWSQKILRPKNISEIFGVENFWDFRENVENFDFQWKVDFLSLEFFKISKFQKLSNPKFPKIFSGRRNFWLQNIFKYSGFFYSNRHRKLFLPMSGQCL